MKNIDQNGLTEQEFLEAYRKKNYPRPYLTADLLVFSQDGSQILLVQRKGHPFLGCWAFPGGFAKADETIEQTALRELQEETGAELSADELIPVGLYSAPGRDPRGWVVSQAYMARVSAPRLRVRAGDDAAQAVWFRITGSGPELQLACGEIRLRPEALAFDHGQILLDARKLQSGRGR